MAESEEPESSCSLTQAMIAAVAVWTLLLGVLGFAPLPELPLNDKALHFFGMGFAAFLIYFIFEVPECVPARHG